MFGGNLHICCAAPDSLISWLLAGMWQLKGKRSTGTGRRPLHLAVEAVNTHFAELLGNCKLEKETSK